MIDELVSQIHARFGELEGELSDPEVIGNRERFEAASRAYRELEPAARLAGEYLHAADDAAGARELLEEAHPALVGLSHWIHANPETGFQETLASGWVAEWLVTGGFEVETGVAGLPTAVVGRTGPGPLHVAICVA